MANSLLGSRFKVREQQSGGHREQRTCNKRNWLIIFAQLESWRGEKARLCNATKWSLGQIGAHARRWTPIAMSISGASEEGGKGKFIRLPRPSIGADLATKAANLPR